MDNLKRILVSKKFLKGIISTLKSPDVELFNLFECFERIFRTFRNLRHNQIGESIGGVGSKISEIRVREPFVWRNKGHF